MIIAFTGHRQVHNPNETRQLLSQQLLELKPSLAISGMAVGFDTLAAKVCIELGVPFRAAVPFIGQEKIWPERVQEEYHHLLTFAEEVVVVSEGGYAAWKMQKRNCYLVDEADLVLAYYDGGPKGGTFNCIEYAKLKEKEIINIYQ